MAPPSTRGSLRRCFISHAHADNALCTPYAERLRASELDIWYDLDNAPEGHRLTAVLQRELQAREALIVFVTPAALDSFWVDLEIGAYLGLMAQDRSRMLLPVRVAPCELPPFLNSVLWIDAVGLQLDEAVARIVRALNSVPLPSSHSVVVSSQAPDGQTGQPGALRGLPGHHDAAVIGVIGGSTPENLAQRLMAEARAETLASHWNDAIIKMEFAFSLSNQTPTIDQLADLTQAYAGAGRWDDALDAAKRASTQAPLRADLWQMQGRAHTALAKRLRAMSGEEHTQAAEKHELDALAAFDRARALITRDDLPGRLALLADRRAALVSAERWHDALINVDDELLLAPNAPTRLSARLELLSRLNRSDEALDVARALASRADASLGDHLALARMLKETGRPDAEIEAALEATAKAAGEDAPAKRRIAHARAEILILPSRLARLGFRIHTRDDIEWITPPTCPVPAGPFTMGSDPQLDSNAASDERSRMTLDLPAVQIARYPVTVVEYDCFLRATKRGAPSKHSQNELEWNAQLKRLDHPVVGVTWFDAFDYAAWLADVTGQPWRLPTEAIWEKAARYDGEDGNNDRIYPWGDEFDAARCNANTSNQGGTTPVGWYGARGENIRAGRRDGASLCGAEDMAGNVWEWTASHYISNLSSAGTMVSRDTVNWNTAASICIRGGSWRDDPTTVRCARRGASTTSPGRSHIGFRLVLATHSTDE